MNARELGQALQGEAATLAARLVEHGADANRFLEPGYPDEDDRMVSIPLAIADMLHAVMLSLRPNPRGRPSKRSTEAAKILAKGATMSKRETSRLIADTADENAENIRRALRRPSKRRK